jgi:hypothetical protein
MLDKLINIVISIVMTYLITGILIASILLIYDVVDHTRKHTIKTHFYRYLIDMFMYPIYLIIENQRQ